MADQFTTQRNLVVLTNYVLKEIQENDPLYTNIQFAIHLQGTEAFKKRKSTIDESGVSKLLSGQYQPKSYATILIPALQEVLTLKESKLKIPDQIPPQMYLKYRTELRDTFGDLVNYIPRTFNQLHGLAKAFTGLWRFFYVPSNFDPACPLLSGNGVFFHPSAESDDRIFGMAIGPQGVRWVVTCWHASSENVYLSWQNYGGDETSLMVAEYPSREVSGAYHTLAKTPGDRFTAETSGWFIFCNFRTVIYADKTSLTGWGSTLPIFQPKHRPFLGLVFFNAADPESLPWTTTKGSVNEDNLVWQDAKARMAAVARPVVRFLDTRYSDEGVEIQPSQLSHLSDGTSNAFEATVSKARTFDPPKPAAAARRVRVQYDALKSEVEKVRKHFCHVGRSEADSGTDIARPYRLRKRAATDETHDATRVQAENFSHGTFRQEFLGDHRKFSIDSAGDLRS